MIWTQIIHNLWCQWNNTL